VTQQEQFDVINQPDFLDELKSKVNDIRTGMEALEASAPEIDTMVGGVPVVVSFVSENESRIQVGQTDTGGTPIYDWTFPANWLAIEGE